MFDTLKSQQISVHIKFGMIWLNVHSPLIFIIKRYKILDLLCLKSFVTGNPVSKKNEPTFQLVR